MLESRTIDPLIGRDAVLIEAREAVTNHRLVTLTGPGGAGKTRLMKALVEDERRYREAFFFDLTQVEDGSELNAALASQLQLGDQGDPGSTIRSWASSGPRLLALDNLEQARGVAVPLVALLDTAADLRVVTTSRKPLGAVGEYEVRISGLAMPAGNTPEEVESSPAGALFLERARSLGALRGVLDSATAEVVARLCRMLDGLPLALELAAARARILSPEAIVRRLEALDTAVLRRAGGASRHRSLEAVLDWSLGLLSPHERTTLEACAACSGGFGVALLEGIVDDGDVLLSLESLVAHGLVVIDEEVAGEPRFRLLESVRLAVLAQAGERAAELARRHALTMAEIVERLAPGIDGAQPRATLGQLDADRMNIEAAIDWAARAAPSIGSRLMWASSSYWAVRGSLGDGIAALREIIRSRSLDERDQVRALGALVRLLGRSDNDTESQEVARDAAARARAIADDAVELEALMQLAYAGEESGLRTDRSDILQRIAAITPTTPREEMLVLHARWLAVMDEHGASHARDFLRATLSSVRSGGSLRHLSIWLANLAYLSQRLGDPAAAISAAEEGLTIARDLGHPDLEAYLLGVLAVAKAQLGETDVTSAAYARSIGIALALGLQLPLTQALIDRGAIAATLGAPLEAAWFLGAAEAVYAPTPVDVFEERAGSVPIWKAAKKRATPVAWELAQREGRSATRAEVVRRALEPVSAHTPASAVPRLRHGVLTPREVEILTLVAEGMSDVAIGERLFISARTASVHVANAKAKLRASSRIDLALRARELLGMAIPSSVTPASF